MRYVADKQAQNVALFSFEMSKQSLTDRMVSGMLSVETCKLKKGRLTDEEFRGRGKQLDDLKKYPPYIDDDPDKEV